MSKSKTGTHVYLDIETKAKVLEIAKSEDRTIRTVLKRIVDEAHDLLHKH